MPHFLLVHHSWSYPFIFCSTGAEERLANVKEQLPSASTAYIYVCDFNCSGLFSRGSVRRKKVHQHLIILY